jgi:hypothetical protein
VEAAVVAAIWTAPLPPGIKVAVTASISVIEKQTTGRRGPVPQVDRALVLGLCVEWALLEPLRRLRKIKLSRCKQCIQLGSIVVLRMLYYRREALQEPSLRRHLGIKLVDPNLGRLARSPGLGRF